MRNKLAKNSIAVGLVTLIVTAGLSFSAQAADPPLAQASAQSVRGTGPLLDPLLNRAACEATNPGAPTGAPADKCDTGLVTGGVSAYAQEASANADSTSAAAASTAPIDFASLGPALDLKALSSGLASADLSTVLTPIANGLGLALDGLDPLLIPLNGALQTALAGVDGSLPVSLGVPAVFAECEATATSATGDSSVADLVLNIGLGPTGVNVPINVDTTPNANLIVGSDEAAQQIADDILDGLRDSLDNNLTLDAALAPFAIIFPTIKTQVLDALLDSLEDPLLTPLGNAIEPLVSGTVNVQDPVSPTSGTIAVTGLHLSLLDGNSVLDLANVTCGPNTPATAAVAAAAVAADPAAADPAAADDAAAAADDAGNDPADAEAQADADVTTTLPATGSPNLLPFWMLGLGLLLFGATVLLNEKRRLEI